MRVRFSSAGVSNNARTEDDQEELLILLKRLIRHKGYARDKIVSEHLKRCFPSAAASGSSVDDEVRRRIAGANVDAKRMAYLIDNANLELRMAHERTVG